MNASGHLRRLRDLHLLDMKGAGNRVYYVPSGRFTQSLEPDPHQVPPQTHQVPADPHQVPPDPHQVPANPAQLLALLPPELRKRLPPRGTRPRRELLRQLLQDLCSWRPLSARELSAILGDRDQKELVRTHLSPMVAEGLLVYTIPEMEKHPDQRYKAPG